MMSVLRARVLVVAAALAMALAFPAAVALAQQVPALPFSPSSSAGGLSSSAASALFCGLPGEAACTFTGPPRLRATSQELSWTFAGDTDTGVTWNNGNSMCLRTGGADGWCVGDNFAPGVYAFYGSQNGSPYLRSVAALDSAVAPGFSFYGAQSTGLFALSGGGLGFTANATNAMNVWQTFVSLAVPLRLDVNGTQANPQIYFVTDPSADSGIWYDSAGVGTVVLSNNSGNAGLRATTDVTLTATDDVEITATDDVAITGGGVTFGVDAVTDVLVIGTGVSGQEGRISAMNDTTGSGGIARNYWLPPRSVGTSTVGPTTCTAGIIGATFFRDDTDDSKPGIECLCTLRNDNATHEWIYRRAFSTQTEGWEGTGCSIP